MAIVCLHHRLRTPNRRRRNRRIQGKHDAGTGTREPLPA